MSRSTVYSLLACVALAVVGAKANRCEAADVAYATFPTYPTTYGIYWSGYGDPYPALYGYFNAGYYYPYSYGWYAFPYGYANWYAYPYAWPYSWSGWYSGPYLYPFRPYYSWFHPVIYYPGAYMFPTPVGYPLVYAAPASTTTPVTNNADDMTTVAMTSANNRDLTFGKTRGDAAGLYALGLEEFRDGRFAKARTLFEAAAALDDADPRTWYFLALCHWKAGNDLAGAEAAKYGAAVQVASGFDRSVIARSLESVQGPMRYRLEDAMRSVDRAKAAAILAAKRNERSTQKGEATALAK